MYRIRLLYDVMGWAYYRRCVALQRYAPPDFEVSIGGNYGQALKERPHDLVLQLVYPCAKNVREHIDKAGYKTLVVSGYNVSAGVQPEYYKKALKFSHHLVVNSKTCGDALNDPENVTWISNGVDRDQFNIVHPTGRRKPRVLSIGSEVHRRNKGFDDVLPMVQKLVGIPCDFQVVNSHGGKSRMAGPALNDWYNRGTIYVVASKHEGTPNPALEAASAGCVVVATRVGNMPELIRDGENGFLVDRDAKQIAAAVRKAHDNYDAMSAAMQESIAEWDWRERSKQYYALFRRLIDAHRANRSTAAQAVPSYGPPTSSTII